MSDLSLTSENLIVLAGFASGLAAATAIFVALFAFTNRYFQVVKEGATGADTSTANSDSDNADHNQQQSGSSSANNTSSTWTKEDQENFRKLREEQEKLSREREERERARKQREEWEKARRQWEERERARRQREEQEKYRREREARNARTSAPPHRSGASKPHPFEKEYSIIGLQPGASRSEVRKAWAEKVKQVHPDVNKSPDAGDRFKELQKAYETLMRIVRK